MRLQILASKAAGHNGENYLLQIRALNEGKLIERNKLLGLSSVFFASDTHSCRPNDLHMPRYSHSFHPLEALTVLVQIGV